MFPLPITAYIYLAVTLVTGGSLWYGHHEHAKYVAFKQQVEIAAKEQNAKVAQEKKDAQVITDNIVAGYTKYINSLQHGSASGQLYVPTTTLGTNGSVCSQEYVDAANETEVQLEYLQQWVEEQCKLGCSK